VGTIFGVSLILFFILFGVTSGTSTPKKSEDNSTKTETKTVSPEEQAKKAEEEAVAKKKADEENAKADADAKAKAEAEKERKERDDKTLAQLNGYDWLKMDAPERAARTKIGYDLYLKNKYPNLTPEWVYDATNEFYKPDDGDYILNNSLLDVLNMLPAFGGY